MAESFRHATIGFVFDESPLNEAAMKHTVLGGGALKCSHDVYVVGIAPDVVKDPSLGSIWTNIPAEDGAFSFEVATSLPYFLLKLVALAALTEGLKDVLRKRSRLARLFVDRNALNRLTPPCGGDGSDHVAVAGNGLCRSGVGAEGREPLVAP
jgi:hypothetical protein